MAKVRKLAIAESIVVEGYNNGMTMRELAITHNCSIGTVRNVLKARGVQARRRGRVKKEATSKLDQMASGV